MSGHIQRIRRAREQLAAFRAMRDLKPRLPVDYFRARVGEPDAWQENYLSTAPTKRRIGIVAGRQTGKTTVVSAYSSWVQTYARKSSILVNSKSLKQASAFIGRMRDCLSQDVPRDLWIMDNQLSIMLPNGSFAMAVPARNADTARGYSPLLLVIDEAAFADPLLLSKLSPSVAASGGSIHMISSPNGRQGFFYEACEGRAAGRHWTLRVRADECPRIDKDFLEGERVILGDALYEQEYEAKFIMTEGAFFSDMMIEQLERGDDYHPDYTFEDDSDRLACEAELLDMQAVFDTSNRIRSVLFDA